MSQVRRAGSSHQIVFQGGAKLKKSTRKAEGPDGDGDEGGSDGRRRHPSHRKKHRAGRASGDHHRHQVDDDDDRHGEFGPSAFAIVDGFDQRDEPAGPAPPAATSMKTQETPQRSPIASRTHLTAASRPASKSTKVFISPEAAAAERGTPGGPVWPRTRMTWPADGKAGSVRTSGRRRVDS